MPLAIAKYNPQQKLPEDALDALISFLPMWVASALDCSGNPKAHVHPDHVEVEVRKTSLRDRNLRDIGITVLANDYPERRQKLEDARIQIQGYVERFLKKDSRLTKCSCSVWVLLAPGSYGEILWAGDLP